MNGDIRVEPVLDRRGLTAFIALPDRLYRGDRNYVAPLRLERYEALGPKNPIRGHTEVRLWLARRGAATVGRISAQINRLHADKYGPGTGNFGLIEGDDDPAVFRALTATAEGWLRERGQVRVQGPYNLSVNEESGLLVEGFDTPPAVMMGHAHPYYARHLEALGYAKAKDLFAYTLDCAWPLPEATLRMVARPIGGRVVVRPMDRRRYKEEVAKALAIYNEAWADNWNALPLTAAEQHHMAAAMRPLIDPDLVWFVDVDGEPIAFAVCLPNLNEAIADLGGRLLPFGWAKLLWRLKIRGVATARVPLMGVRKRFGHRPLGSAAAVLVIEALRKAALAKGYRQSELSWILEDNQPIRRLIDAFGGRHTKTYRIYEKALG
ncbi:MAG: dATP pyrophosphohydrolase [Alphaproteobacteria bacterium]|nr:dATP pyrophosphohydrolase [Alphaproteobacteria bacterium]